MPTFKDQRIRVVNDHVPNRSGDFVLYWMQAYRRLNHNHALDFAIQRAKDFKKPLVIFEGLRLDYPWANDRHHYFILSGMRENSIQAQKMKLNYWPFVEKTRHQGRGLLKKIAKKAVMIVTDDFPTFIIPRQYNHLAQQVNCPLFAVDSNSIVPLKMLGEPVKMAAHLRPRIHRQFAEAWQHRSNDKPEITPSLCQSIDPIFETHAFETHAFETHAFETHSFENKHKIDPLISWLETLPIDHSVAIIPHKIGGYPHAKNVLDTFVSKKLNDYAEGRNQPSDPESQSASGLSPYLHYGHISIEEVIDTVLQSEGDWTPEMLNSTCRGKREGFFHRDNNINGFLDEAITWRDVGYHWHYMQEPHRCYEQAQQDKLRLGWDYPTFCGLQSSLPAWAWLSLSKHEADQRDYLYSLEKFEKAQTHDPLWNAAQKELVMTGRIHNYLRMLWGKKVLEWSKSPEHAYFILEHLNNKYALDGRDPNSYTGILWCFGLFDRPWAPERKVFGVIRFMSSANTAKKYSLDDYYRYIHRLTAMKEGGDTLFPDHD